MAGQVEETEAALLDEALNPLGVQTASVRVEGRLRFPTTVARIVPC